MDFLTFITTVFFPIFKEKFITIFFAPVIYPEMMWIVFPLIVSVLLMEIYFGRYKREEMGYHMALENTVFLLFVAVDMIRYLIHRHAASLSVKTFLVGIIIIYAISLAFLDFFHKLPRNIAFKISSKAIVSFTAYLGIVSVYSDILIGMNMVSAISTLLAMILLFGIYHSFLKFIQFLQPETHDEVDDLIHSVEKELEATAREMKIVEQENAQEEMKSEKKKRKY